MVVRLIDQATQLNPAIEFSACAESAIYFVHTYCRIYDTTAETWIPFLLWPAQARTLKTIQDNKLTIIMKARQIGVTWLALGFALWLMLFHPEATILMFSRRDDEAINLLNFRLKGMYNRLPSWAKVRHILEDTKHVWRLSNGSRAYAFPTTAGDSYTGSLVIADEFDLVKNQKEMLGSINPTIENGGRMVLLSRPDKNRPVTQFKRIYKAARAGENSYAAVFLPWYVHPGRDRAWYERQRKDILSRSGTPDDLYEQYPETEAQALAAGYGSLIYPEFSPENISQEADYHPEWTVFWGCDDGYARGDGPGTAGYHPRVVLLGQFTPIGGINIFAEYRECLIPKYEMTINEVLTWEYPRPELCYVDSSASMFRAALSQTGLHNIGATHEVVEGIKNLRRLIADGENVRLLKIHPRCKGLIAEMETYKYDENSTQSKSGEPKALKIDDHGPDALRYLAWRLKARG